MNNKIYINKDDITTVRSFNKTLYHTIYTRHFKAKRFFGITFGKDETLYSTVPDFYRNDGFTDKINILYSLDVYIGQHWYKYKDGAFSIDEQSNLIFRNPYVIVNTRSGESFVKFFQNEKEMETYIDNLGIENRLFGLEYN